MLQFLGQHDGVLDADGRAGGQVRGGYVGRVAEQRNAAAMPRRRHEYGLQRPVENARVGAETVPDAPDARVASDNMRASTGRSIPPLPGISGPAIRGVGSLPNKAPSGAKMSQPSAHQP